ncbi:MAG: lipocalin-like domain-containing protein [Pseudomonadota bacterium]
MSDSEHMVGLWGLVSYHRTEADGSVTQPFGAAPVGRLLYTADGYMSAHIMPGGDGAEGMAPTSVVAYCGGWKVGGGEVIHDVLVGSGTVPSGAPVSREIGWQDGQLVLSAAGWKQGETKGRRALVWRRVA